MTKGALTSVKSQEVKLLVSSPRPVSGISLRENIQDFESLSETIRFTRCCELASFWHRVSAGMSYKTRPDEDDGFWQIIPLCREYYSAENKIERFRGFLELISRFEFKFRRRGNYIFWTIRIFWCVQSSITRNVAVHVPVLWPVCTHTIPFRMLWRPWRFMIT